MTLNTQILASDFVAIEKQIMNSGCYISHQQKVGKYVNLVVKGETNSIINLNI